MKKILKFFTSTRFVLILTFLLNVTIFFLITFLASYYYYTLISLVSFIIAIILMFRSKEDAYYKLCWLFIIILVPLFGAVLYAYLKSNKLNRKQRKKWYAVMQNSAKYLKPNKKQINNLKKSDATQYGEAMYIQSMTHMPVYENTQAEYLKNGTEYFESLFDALQKANKYILLQYFILKPGKIWDRLLEILKQKAEQGVEIKLLYDDFGCLDRFPRKYLKKLNNINIQTVPFNKIVPTVNLFINYRDHRKIVVIDGKIGFTGGINIGDEYANLKDIYGYWKDTGVKLEGDAVWSLIVLFFNNWRIATNEKIDLNKYKTTYQGNILQGNIQVFGTGPLFTEAVARNNYINMINDAKHFIYITSPYFVVDKMVIDAIKLCAKRGVDIRIILPNTPDKKWVFYLAHSYYEELIKVGVKIYEYTPGFIHAKMVLVDGKTCCIGTINFDFRSLYLHFEDGVMLYNTPCIQSIKNDIDNIIKNSFQVDIDYVKKRSLWEKFIAGILKLFAPLM